MNYERVLEITERHSRLVELIQAGDYSSRELATKLAVSEQTIYRDIEFLRRRGLAIVSKRVELGWAYRIETESERKTTRQNNKRV